jgi:hypothetical protein
LSSSWGTQRTQHRFSLLAVRDDFGNSLVQNAA